VVMSNVKQEIFRAAVPMPPVAYNKVRVTPLRANKKYAKTPPRQLLNIQTVAAEHVNSSKQF